MLRWQKQNIFQIFSSDAPCENTAKTYFLPVYLLLLYEQNKHHNFLLVNAACCVTFQLLIFLDSTWILVFASYRLKRKNPHSSKTSRFSLFFFKTCVGSLLPLCWLPKTEINISKNVLSDWLTFWPLCYKYLFGYWAKTSLCCFQGARTSCYFKMVLVFLFSRLYEDLSPFLFFGRSIGCFFYSLSIQVLYLPIFRRMLVGHSTLTLTCESLKHKKAPNSWDEPMLLAKNQIVTSRLLQNT